MSFPHALAFTLLGLGKILVVWLAPSCFHPGEDCSRIWLGFMGCLNLTIGTVYLADLVWRSARRLLVWRPTVSGPLVVRIPPLTMQAVTGVVYPWHRSLPRSDAFGTAGIDARRVAASAPETLAQVG